MIVQPAETREQRAASTASGGTALTTTLALISIPIGSQYLSITPRNFSAAVVARYTLNPFLTILATTDLLATGEQTDSTEPTSLCARATQNISTEMQDGDTEDFDINSFDTIANFNALYVGSPLPFRGVAVDLNNKNDTASVLTVKYISALTVWTDISDTDGTDDSGDTMKQDGNVTWTIPDPWVKTSLKAQGETTRFDGPFSDSLYWTRWEFSVQLDSTVDLVQMRPLNRSTAYAELLSGQERELSLSSNAQYACVEALTNAGTAKLIVNVDAVSKEFR